MLMLFDTLKVNYIFFRVGKETLKVNYIFFVQILSEMMEEIDYDR